MTHSAPIPNSKALIKRLFTYVWPHWIKFAVAIIAMAVVAATEPAVAAMMEPLIDGTFIDRDPETIIMVPLMMVGIFFIRGVARVLSTVGIASVATHVVMQVRLDLYRHIQQLPQSFMDANRSGALLSKMTFEVEQLSAMASQVWLTLVRDTLVVVGLLGYLFYVSWQLTLVVLLSGPIIALIIKVVNTKLRASSRTLQEGMGTITHRIEESLRGHRLIKLYQAETQEFGKFSEVSNKLRVAYFKRTVVGGANSPLVQFVVSIALAFVVYFAANLEGESAMSPGQFIAFFTAMGMLFSPIRSLTSLNEPIQRGLVACDSIFKLMDTLAENDTGTKQLTDFKGNISISELSFSYQGSESQALSELNLQIKAGETVALVGASGSGKSTLIQLLPRFYDPQQGQIQFDGIDSRQFSLASIRDQIAYVDQEVMLFDESVAMNVAFGSAVIDPVRVKQALNRAHAMEFVELLEGGIDAPVGEQGTMLSGGQRQRLALARAFYKDAPLLILDEATSALDNESERKVQVALEQLCENRTTIIVAHRLSTVEKADRIVVMQEGRIVEVGSHDALMVKNGAYRNLYRELQG